MKEFVNYPGANDFEIRANVKAINVLKQRVHGLQQDYNRVAGATMLPQERWAKAKQIVDQLQITTLELRARMAAESGIFEADLGKVELHVEEHYHMTANRGTDPDGIKNGLKVAKRADLQDLVGLLRFDQIVAIADLTGVGTNYDTRRDIGEFLLANGVELSADSLSTHVTQSTADAAIKRLRSGKAKP